MWRVTRAGVVGLLTIFVLAGCAGAGQRLAAATTSPSASLSPSASRSPAASPTPVVTLAACNASPSTASYARLQTSPPPPGSTSGAAGEISGHVTTPSEVIFPQLVYAVSTAGAAYGAYSTETVWDQSDYTIKGVAPGKYYVYATDRPITCQPAGDVTGASYDVAVKCGLDVSCTDHTPIAVAVQPGTTTQGIDPVDWYLDTPIPAPPRSVVPADPALEAPPNASPTARAAATALEKHAHSAIFVDQLPSCPTNRACFSVGIEHDGTDAAYFVGEAGSNGNWVACVSYVYRTTSGWHGLRAPFCAVGYTAVGQTVNVFVGFGDITSCVNVRSAPAGARIGCVKAGTPVRIDAGPVYKPFSGSNGMWWHIAGKGWIADDYVPGWSPGP